MDPWSHVLYVPIFHDDVIKWKHFPRYWPFVGEFTGHRWIPLTKASDAELWCFLWSAPWINGWVNNREDGDLRRHRAHYDVIVMSSMINLEHWGNRKMDLCQRNILGCALFLCWMSPSSFFTNITINVLFHHTDYYFYWHVYAHGYTNWTTDLGLLQFWFCNRSPLGVFPLLGFLLWYWIEHVTIGFF